MKTYEYDGNLNYDDLKGGDIGNSKGYGPVGEYWREWTDEDGKRNIACGQVAQTAGGSSSLCGGCTCNAFSRFCLNIKCHNWAGDGANRYACSTSQALGYAHDLEDNNWYAANIISDEVLRKCATLVRETVRSHDRGNRVKGYVKVQGKFWGSYDWDTSY